MVNSAFGWFGVSATAQFVENISKHAVKANKVVRINPPLMLSNVKLDDAFEAGYVHTRLASFLGPNQVPGL